LPIKNLLLIAILALTTKPAHAQNARVTINNHTDFEAIVTLYGNAAVSCTTAACNTTYITNPISVPVPSSPAFPTGTSTWGPNDPCDVSTSSGWASAPASCPVTWCPISGLPADFQWTLAEVDLVLGSSCWTVPATFPIFVCPWQPGCLPGLGPLVTVTGGCSSTHPNLDVSWTSSGGSLADVTIDINQY
jgi:hypothetical protein